MALKVSSHKTGFFLMNKHCLQTLNVTIFSLTCPARDAACIDSLRMHSLTPYQLNERLQANGLLFSSLSAGMILEQAMAISDQHTLQTLALHHSL